jgi:hypothetical protein
MAAVFGAIYHLNLTIDSFNVDNETNLYVKFKKKIQFFIILFLKIESKQLNQQMIPKN